MTAIIWSPQALEDLESIREYIAQDSTRYAELVVARIVSSVERLRSFLESGRVVPELNRPDVREVIVRPYRVVYRLRFGLVLLRSRRCSGHPVCCLGSCRGGRTTRCS